MLLFINSVEKQCGVYQYGIRLFNQLSRTDIFEYAEIGSLNDLINHLNTKRYDACILNYHSALFGWWNQPIKTFYIYHEGCLQIEPKYVLNTDPDCQMGLGIPRPLYQGNITEIKNEGLTFGSFGFGFENKGFERIITTVQYQYDNATIKLLIPFARFGDENGEQARRVGDKCKSLVTKPGIKLEISHNFLSDKELVNFLASNDMNIFLYDYMPGRGCSSVIDYALTANKPIAISNSLMFRHIFSEAICAYKRPLKDILADGNKHILPFLKKWNPITLQETILKRINDA
jgi:hypothetical protein